MKADIIIEFEVPEGTTIEELTPLANLLIMLAGENMNEVKGEVLAAQIFIENRDPAVDEMSLEQAERDLAAEIRGEW